MKSLNNKGIFLILCEMLSLDCFSLATALKSEGSSQGPSQFATTSIFFLQHIISVEDSFSFPYSLE